MVWPIDFRSCVQKNIYKIFIPYACIDSIREWLSSMDIVEASIYGTSKLDLISSEISKIEEIKFIDFIKDMIDKYKNIES